MPSMTDRRQLLKTVGIGCLAGAGIRAFGPQMAAAAQPDGSADKSNVAR